MLFQRINRTNPEKIFMVVYNSTTTAMTNGQAVIWDFKTDKNGVGVIVPTARATNAGIAAAGIVAETIAASAYGLIQVYGYHAATRIRTITGHTTPVIVAGSPLALAAAGAYCLESFVSGATSIMVYPCAFALEATSSWATTAKAVFIKAL